ncbi:alcohol dehydrogenase catalytic domain-containing protein [Paludisphaera borealis]|uniref:alcohol dehydrogenase catalytic domain-containing protein n=1 Tax=Paludisphaera borealis TaxID=1387353 RepID=UPI0035A31186
MDRPVPQAGEVLVRVQAAAINPSDVKNVLGKMGMTTVPRTPGRDFAGVVEQGPPEWIGRPVFGTGGDLGFRRDGSHAESTSALPPLRSEFPSRLIKECFPCRHCRDGNSSGPRDSPP